MSRLSWSLLRIIRRILNVGSEGFLFGGKTLIACGVFRGFRDSDSGLNCTERQVTLSIIRFRQICTARQRMRRQRRCFADYTRWIWHMAGRESPRLQSNWKGYTASVRCLKCGEYTSRWAKMENQLVDEILFDMDTLTVCVA